jgi:hypothetical protein
MTPDLPEIVSMDIATSGEQADPTESYRVPMMPSGTSTYHVLLILQDLLISSDAEIRLTRSGWVCMLSSRWTQSRQPPIEGNCSDGRPELPATWRFEHTSMSMRWEGIPRRPSRNSSQTVEY